MKRETKQYYEQIINESLYYMYRYLDTNITLELLAKHAGLSAHHFHRVFHAELGVTLYAKLQSIRLQKAANLLITNTNSSISEIAQQCGYTSHSAFIRVFKKRFNLTPTHWRAGAYKEFSKENITHSPYVKNNKISLAILEPKIEQSKAITVGYIRHKGYNKSIKKPWNLLKAYCLENELKLPRQFGLHHDNPSIVELGQCSYVAAIEIKEDSPLAKKLSLFTIPPSLCAVFHFKGEYGEVLNLIRYVYHEWLPSSGFEAKTLPPYAHYHKNHFLSEDERFELDFYLPIETI